MQYLLLLILLPSLLCGQEISLKTPNISGNALFLVRESNWGNGALNPERNGIDLQEAELAFYSDVDPYSRLSMLFTLHPEYELDSTEGAIAQHWVFEPEELFAELNQLTGTTLKIGKFKAAFGKHNLLHSHTFPFVESPLINSRLLGDEGLNDVGLSAALLFPTAWFSELTLQYLRGEGENEAFSSGSPNDGVKVGHLKNLFELSDALTMEIGASYATGNNHANGNTALYGGDLTWKWRPLSGGKYRSWIVSAEYIARTMESTDFAKEKADGVVIWSQWQFAERWSVLYRYETFYMQRDDESEKTQKNSAGIIFKPSEFSSYRLEGNLLHGPQMPNGSSVERKLFVQANFTIGSHPSHDY